MNAKRQYFKLNEDDILGIVSDYLSTQVDFETFKSRLAFVENEDNEYRIIAAYGELEDESIDEIDFEVLDKTLKFNGARSTMPKEFQIDVTNPEQRAILQRLTTKLNTESNE